MVRYNELVNIIVCKLWRLCSWTPCKQLNKCPLMMSGCSNSSVNVSLNTADQSNPSVSPTSTGCVDWRKGGRMVAISGSSKLFPLYSANTLSVTGDDGGGTGEWWEIGARCSPPTATPLFVFLISILIGYRQFPFPLSLPTPLLFFRCLYHIHPLLSALPNEQKLCYYWCRRCRVSRGSW